MAWIINTLDRWAQSGLAGPATGLWAVLQSAILPGPSDTLLVPLGLARPSKAVKLGLWAAGGSVLGSLIAYAIGALVFDLLGMGVVHFFGFTEADMAAAAQQFSERGWIVIAVGLLPLLSSKVIAYVAGALGYPLPTFILITTVLRGGRFLLTGLLLRYGGTKIRSWLDRHMKKQAP